MTYTAKYDDGRKVSLQSTTLSAAKREAKLLVTDRSGIKLIDGGIHVAYHAPSANRAAGERFRWKNL